MVIPLVLLHYDPAWQTTSGETIPCLSSREPFCHGLKPVVSGTVNLSHGDVARNLWTFKTVRQAKQNLIDKGFDEAAVRQHITYLDPIFNAPGLKGKKILLQLSRQDKIFPKGQTKHLKQAFEAAGLDMTYLENKHLGHIPAATKNVMSTKIIDTFYSS